MVVLWQIIPLLKLPRNQVKQNKSHRNMNAENFQMFSVLYKIEETCQEREKRPAFSPASLPVTRAEVILYPPV